MLWTHLFHFKLYRAEQFFHLTLPAPCFTALMPFSRAASPVGLGMRKVYTSFVPTNAPRFAQATPSNHLWPK